MRIVAGSARGRRIEAPDGSSTRPTSDRVREAMFNALGSLDAVRDAEVVDLFAGSGALGLEALSRGASSVVFVEHDSAAAAVIDRNRRALGFEGRSRILRSPVESALENWTGTVDLVLADPPYRFDAWPDLLGRVRPHLAGGALVVVESGQPIALPEGWEKVRERTYGSTVVAFLESTGVPE